MITFVLSLVALVVGYLVYGRIVERVFAPDDRPTPAVSMADGVDYVVLPGWKIFMIQFLNIAGTGPIFGAIMGAKFGPSAYLWIVLGCIFAGAVHDYLSGMLSMRHGGAGLPELVGAYLGGRTKKVMLVFSVFLLLMVGAVFVYSPAIILGKLCSDSLTWVYIWCLIIFVYYFLATMLPIDKIIGRIYPLFAIAMLFMAVALMVVLFVRWPSLPELTDGLANMNPSLGTIFPCLFITIACGAISGFHATQSPLMARCIKSERQGRPLFYGAMITEGVATRADGLRVDVKVNEAEMQLTQVDNGLSLAKMLLCQLCGLPVDGGIILEDEDKDDISSPVSSPVADVEAAIDNRAELKMLQNTVDISRQATRLVRSAYLPQVALTGGFLATNPSLYNGFERKFKGVWNVGVVVRIPVWNWFESTYKIRASKTATSIAQLELDDAREKVELQVNQSSFKVAEAEKKLAMAKKNTEQADENLRCANLGFKEGVMDVADVMAAQTAWLQARSQKIDADIDVKLTQTNLRKVLGETIY